jgi:SAM-dependent methyltransferase
MAPRPYEFESTGADVTACYERFLGRPPESEAAIAGHLRTAPRLWDLIALVYDSDEARRHRRDVACGEIAALQDPSAIATDADPEGLALMTNHIRAVWSRYGREEAYYSVLTNPAFLRERVGVHDIETFYATGLAELDGFERVCRRNGLEPDPRWSIFELGCGVGRVGEAFASRYQSYAGADISADHLAIARRRFAERGWSNTRLLLLEPFLAGDLTYDVFFSVIVLQHNPPPIMSAMLEACLSRINSGGLAYFQIPCHLYGYQFSVDRYLAGEGQSQDMEIHALPQHHVFALLARNGLDLVEVTPDDRIGPIGFSYTFLARKP